MIIRIDFRFCRNRVGTEYRLIDGTYARTVCDCCGHSRQCDYYIHEGDRPTDVTFLDLCRSCRKNHAEVVG